MDGVAGWFERRGEIPLAPPRSLREYGPLSDDPDRPGDDFHADGICGVALGLEYCDTHGWPSTRLIRCLGIDTRAPAAIRAYCNVRRATRTFRLDRIISIVHLRSGGILAGEEHINLLAPYLPGYDRDLRVQAVRDLERATKDGVFTLLQLAMPEGRLGDASREIVLDYIRSEAEAVGCAQPAINLVELWIDNLAPPLDAVVAAVTKLLGEKDKFVRLLPWLLKVMRSQDAVDQDESIRELIASVRTHYRRKLREWPKPFRAIS